MTAEPSAAELSRPPSERPEPEKSEPRPAGARRESGPDPSVLRPKGAPPVERRRRSVVAVLALALVVCGLALVWQIGRTRALEAEALAIRSELAEARVALDAYEIRMEAIRGSVGDLGARVEVLQRLVSEPPGPPPAPPEASPAR